MKAELYELTHVTTYDYRAPVTVSHHLMRLCPRRLPRQAIEFHSLAIDPAPATLSQRIDYFGNDTTFATIQGAHRSLRITSRSRVAVGPAFIPDPSETPPWEAVRGRCRSDRSLPVLEAIEYTFASPLVSLEPDFADYAAASFPPGRSLLAAAVELNERIHADFTFDPAATTLSTPLRQVFAQRRGVCQDFAHLLIACFRSLGLPARYVSGYLETTPPPGQARLVGADASHAWVSLFLPDLGWVDLDPTNRCLPSLRHITVAWGRDYSDVSPIRGVLTGSGEHALAVAVDVVPLGPTQVAFGPGG
ncbi:MAG: transglutaminase family protein [Verrucomicrobia bacterium]|nr:transglutaminase family protein [Verrucomicrobiota bacterium]